MLPIGCGEIIMPDDTRSEDAVDRYAHLRDELLGHLRDLVPVQAVRECPCEELREKLLSSSFNLVVLGQFKRGKTSLINALLGASILPVGVVPLTSIPTVLTYGEALRSKVYLNDGQVLEVRSENLAEYITEKGNPKNVKAVSHALVTYPSDYLKDGVRIIDTPGVGSVYQHNTDVAYQYLPKSDAALFLLSVDQPLSQAELDFLKEVRQYSNLLRVISHARFEIDLELKSLTAPLERTMPAGPSMPRLAGCATTSSRGSIRASWTSGGRCGAR
jgi:hypothetical protein